MSRKPGVKLSAKWQLDAALLSRPVDLNALVTLSKSSPRSFIDAEKTLGRIIRLLLNEQNAGKSDRDTKLDALNILANVASGGKEAVAEVRASLQEISEWFEDYMASEEQDPDQEPELHKAMVLLIARCWNYKLKTEDVLELTRGNRRVALCTVVGLLEDGETYSTELRQRQRPGEGQMGQWEHELVIERYEKPLLLQICRLLRGFTHPGTYFEAVEGELALYSVERFSEEMSGLLTITLRSNLVEKLSSALFECLFGESRTRNKRNGRDDSIDLDGDLLEESDHIAVVSVNAFIQNLYFYAAENNETFRLHLLEETLFVPRLLLPYLDKCILHVSILNSQDGPARSQSKEDDEERFGWWTHFPQLVNGISSSMRTLIIATFRASQLNLLGSSLLKLNPTLALLKATDFCVSHEYIFSLLCILNINSGAVDLSSVRGARPDSTAASPVELLEGLSAVFAKMSSKMRARVHRRVSSSGALPVSRDMPSYAAMMSVLSGGEAGQLRYAAGVSRDFNDSSVDDSESISVTRAEAKAEHRQRLNSFSSVPETPANPIAHGDDKESRIAPSSMDPKGTSSHIKVTATKTAGLSSLSDLPSLAVPKASAYSHSESSPQHRSTPKSYHSDPELPKEFLCAINGHVMKEPVRSSTTNLVFEKSTIELWLNTRGAVCPITNTILEKKDLIPDDELRNRIMRYHIQQTSLRTAGSNNDDLYDF